MQADLNLKMLIFSVQAPRYQWGLLQPCPVLDSSDSSFSVHHLLHLVAVASLREHFPDSELSDGMAHVGRDLTQRNQHEAPLLQARVRDRQLCRPHRRVTVEQDVDIYGARALGDASGMPPQRPLNSL